MFNYLRDRHYNSKNKMLLVGLLLLLTGQLKERSPAVRINIAYGYEVFFFDTGSAKHPEGDK